MSLITPELFSEVADGVTGNGLGDCVSLLREPDAANPHVRFDERGVETEHGGASKELPVTLSKNRRLWDWRSLPLCPGHRPGPRLVRHRQTKGSATDRLHLNHRATPRLHLKLWPSDVV